MVESAASAAFPLPAARPVADLRGGSWELDGDLEALEAEIEDGRLRSETYPDPLARVWSALLRSALRRLPALAAARLRGGRLGRGDPRRRRQPRSLHAGDSLGPLLFVGCGPGGASEREQWTLRDVAPAVLEHFGLGER